MLKRNTYTFWSYSWCYIFHAKQLTSEMECKRFWWLRVLLIDPTRAVKKCWDFTTEPSCSSSPSSAVFLSSSQPLQDSDRLNLPLMLPNLPLLLFSTGGTLCELLFWSFPIALCERFDQILFSLDDLHTTPWRLDKSDRRCSKSIGRAKIEAHYAEL